MHPGHFLCGVQQFVQGNGNWFSASLFGNSRWNRHDTVTVESGCNSFGFPSSQVQIWIAICSGSGIRRRLGFFKSLRPKTSPLPLALLIRIGIFPLCFGKRMTFLRFLKRKSANCIIFGGLICPQIILPVLLRTIVPQRVPGLLQSVFHICTRRCANKLILSE